MKIDVKLLCTSLICILALICFNIIENIENNEILSSNIIFYAIITIVIITGILQFVHYLTRKKKHNLKIYLDIHIPKKKPEYKSSNDELMDLIKEYKKNNKTGGQK